MCGIFGIIPRADGQLSEKFLASALKDLFLLSESRGKEASGAAFLSSETISVVKHALPASDLVRSGSYRTILGKAFENRGDGQRSDMYLQGVVGHSRLVTNGNQQIHENNQPVIKDGIVGIHNGIITNADDLWRQFPVLQRTSDIDTEILLGLIHLFHKEMGSLLAAIRKTYSLIEGSASVALLFSDLNVIVMATDNGSLYLGCDGEQRCLIFASERFILRRLFDRGYVRRALGDMRIEHVEAGTGCVVDVNAFRVERFDVKSESHVTEGSSPAKWTPRAIVDVSPEKDHAPSAVRIPGQGPYILLPSFVDEFSRNRDAVARLRRCSRCILPETMPFMDFDSQGVCNYCRSYKPLRLKGLTALKEKVEAHRKGNGDPECLVTFSGGRDSCYGLHFAKTVLHLQPVAYTYDWGMVTDLGRRNQMRLCGKLGVEHILVSADISKKRRNIRKNVTAWLKKPNLGTVPLFMAGDKQYFYYANKIGKQTGCKIIVLCENLLETTRFKSGFCGVPPRHGSAHTYTLTLADKAQMALYYGWQYLTNPAYLNASLLDTLSAFASYYVIPHPYVNLYEYIPWDEQEIASTLIRDYNWETAGDTQSTWRIGDGTAPFYNYIYYTLAGLTENDTFRSNQIREGMISRKEALRLAERDNEPRYESIQWYCDVIGIDFEGAMRTINGAPKLYAC